ncbi:M48 family metallopeptidase [Thiomicrorhabdus indica]|uniref:M48 family metallopeptidase n=1 Tax=Thiomicrorhabdus indica TaxID=2267253 RepID=UPI002AA8F686|nr:M48 family metallopeptidase [Thiomicrorhabdus indica]
MNRLMNRLMKTTLLSLGILSLNACVSQSTKSGDVGIERKQLLLVSEQEMMQGGAQAYAGVLNEAKQNKQLNTDPVLTKRVRAIADRLIPQTAIFRPDAPKWNWEVNVLKSDELNAWCMPGGKIAFYTGIIEKLQLTDAEIAAIMGHEMAHALREHSRERASNQMVQNLGLVALGALAGVEEKYLGAAALAMQVTLTLPNSRTHEIEADRMGVELAARAGYDPYAAVTLWEKMQKQSGGGQPMEFLSTHPAHENRIKDLNVYAKRVYPLYLQTKK